MPTGQGAHGCNRSPRRQAPNTIDAVVIRIVHTADIHLDACFAGERLPAAFGNRRRQSLRDVTHAILRRASEWPADVVLLAGDVFEHDRVSTDTLAFLKSTFAEIAPILVFIAPGNHDPLVPGSGYLTESWPENVVIFDSPEWQAHALDTVPLTVHGFAFDGPEISQNPFGTLQVPEDGRVHVAVAHGSEMGSLPPGKGAYAPFHAVDAATANLSYLALGHYHAMKIIEGDFATRMAYAGAPEGHGFGETGAHYYLEVEIEGNEVAVRPVQSSRVEYSVHTIDCSDFATSQQIVESVRALPKPDNGARIARVTLVGESRSDWHHEIPSVRDALEPDFEHLVLIDATSPAEDYESLARDQTSLGAFIAQINAELRDTDDDERHRLLERAREVGLAAYRGRDLPIVGEEGG